MYHIPSGQGSLQFAPREEVDTEVSLNPYQQRALENAWRAETAFCIHGPPGTGKTRTLSAFNRSAVAHGNRVLVTAHSNQAVDNLIIQDSTPDEPTNGSLHEAAQADEITMRRVGRQEKCRDIVCENYLVPAADRVGNADVVGATTNGAVDFSFQEFDIAVVDEATQASIPATLIPLLHAEKTVLAGDPEQLPPFTGAKMTSDDDVLPSLFKHLLEVYGADLATLLQRQYRMNSAIAEFSNIQYYSGELEHADANAVDYQGLRTDSGDSCRRYGAV